MADKIILVVSEDGMFANKPVPVEKMVNIFLAATTQAIKQIEEQLDSAVEAGEITSKDKEVGLKDLFDGLNSAYSRQLEISFPEMELHPELTEEAIKQVMAKENVMIQHRAKAKNKKAAKS